MDKKVALTDQSERFFAYEPDAAFEVKPDARGVIAPILLCGVAFLSLALAISSPLSSGEERGGELSDAVEVIGEAIEAERQGEEY